MDRARRAWDAAAASIERWKDDGGAEWIFVQHDHLAYYAWVFAVAEEPPHTVLDDLGDFFGNLASALDALAWSAYIEGGGRAVDAASRHVYFPIVAPGKQWNSGSRVNHASSDFHQIAQEEQDVPGDNRLFMLTRFNNSAKHRSSLLSSMTPSGSTETVWPVVPDGFEFHVRIPTSYAELMEGAATPAVEWMLSKAGTDEPCEVPDGFTLEQPRPRRKLGLTDGESFLDLSFLPHITAKVSRIVERMKHEVPDQPRRAVTE